MGKEERNGGREGVSKQAVFYVFRFVSFLCSVGCGTQDLVHAGQALYHPAASPARLCFLVSVVISRHVSLSAL